MTYIDKRLRLSTIQAIADQYGALVSIKRSGTALPRCYCLTLNDKAKSWGVILNPQDSKPVRMLGELSKEEWEVAIRKNIERIQQGQLAS